jgi:hypothetical protein
MSPNGHNNYAKLTEAEFLSHEAELAKTAIGNALSEFKTELAKAGDVRLWAHHYPWVTLGVAAATGFTLAAIVNKGLADAEPPHDKSSERLIRETAKAPYNDVPGSSQPRVGDSLLGSLFSLARTALEASLVSAIRAEGIERVYAEGVSRAAKSPAVAGECPPNPQPVVADSMGSAGL